MVSPEEAIANAGKMKDLRTRARPRAPFRGRYTAIDADLLYSRFAKAYGTQTRFLSAICDEAGKQGTICPW